MREFDNSDSNFTDDDMRDDHEAPSTPMSKKEIHKILAKFVALKPGPGQTRFLEKHGAMTIMGIKSDGSGGTSEPDVIFESTTLIHNANSLPNEKFNA